MLTKLPVDVAIYIIQCLEIKDRNRMMETCTYLRDLILHNAICWSHLNFRPHHSISDDTLLYFINRYLLPKDDTGDNQVTRVKCVVFLDLSGCQYLSSRFVCWILSLFTGLRELRLNQFGSPEIMENRVMGSFHSIILESFGIIFYNSQLPTLRVCDSTLDTAAKFILLQNELTKPKNQFFEIQETGIVYNQHYGRIGLGVSFEELGGTLGDLTQLMSLCLHHKNIHPDDSISWIHRLNKLTDLDISFCTIQPRVLTQLIKETIPRLKSLKLMDIKITESELNIIKEQGSMLECLHLFCGFTFRPNNSLIGIVGDTVGNLPSLTELKLYSQGSETLDAIALNLNLRIFQKLYLSTFTKTTCTVGRTSISPCGNRPRGAIRQRRELSGAPITRNGIDHIARCTHLTELRLGSIVLEDESLSTLYRSLCSLEVLELRGCQGNSDSNSSTHSTSNRLLADIDKLTKLKELHLYSITVHVFPIECINNIKSLEYLTLYDSGPFIESSGAVEYWLTEMDKLNIVVLSQLSKPTSLWLTYINLIFSENKTDYHNVIFKRVCRTKTWNVL